MMKRGIIDRVILKMASIGCFNRMSDEKYLKMMFRIIMGRTLNLDNPITYNEKLQWLKLYDYLPEYSRLVDKYEVKKYISEIIGEEYIIPTLGIWNDFEEIDIDFLPNQFVLKCTHDSGGYIICKDKSKFDINSARKKINKLMKTDYFYWGREYPYKNIQPRIIAEQYIGEIESVPEDYKFYTFNGEIDCVMICKGREKGYPTFVYYDTEWKHLKYLKEESNMEDDAKPENYLEMLEIVRKLSRGSKHVRVDLYNVNGKIYFGELTYYNQSGFDLDISEETDYYWGQKINIPLKQEK